MKPPRPFPWIVLISAILFAANLSVWIWTNFDFHQDDACFEIDHRGSRDRIGVQWSRLVWARITYHPGHDLTWVPGYRKLDLIFLGIGYLQTPSYATGTNGVKWNTDHRILMIHCWFIAALTAFLPIRWLILLRRSHSRDSSNLCANCGYDLRAHPPGAKCPECGTPVPREQIPTIT